jgi:D-lactate dehydrogenase (cytochrome)
MDLCTADAARGEAIVKASKAKEYQFADDAKDLDKLWEARRGCYLASISYNERKGDRVYLSDTCVPISQVAQMISETESDFENAGFACIICAHIADGNFHCCIPYQPAQQAQVQAIETRMIQRALRTEGACDFFWRGGGHLPAVWGGWWIGACIPLG